MSSVYPLQLFYDVFTEGLLRSNQKDANAINMEGKKTEQILVITFLSVP